MPGRRRKVQVEPIRIPTVSFYSHRGFIDQMEGVVDHDSKKDKSKGPCLVAFDHDGMPMLVNRLHATYQSNMPVLEISWSEEETRVRPRESFEAAGYPVTLGGMWGMTPRYTTYLKLTPQSSIIDAQRVIQREVASRFRVTSERPTALWMLLHPDPGQKMNQNPRIPRRMNPIPFKVTGSSPLTGGGEYGVSDVAFERPAFKLKGQTLLQVPVRFEYVIEGPDASGKYTYHAQYYFTQPDMAGAIMSLPGTLLDDGTYTLTEMRAPARYNNRLVTRQLAQSELDQAAARVAAAVRAWNGVPAAIDPEVVTIARPEDTISAYDLTALGIRPGPHLQDALRQAQALLDEGHDAAEILQAFARQMDESRL